MGVKNRILGGSNGYLEITAGQSYYRVVMVCSKEKGAQTPLKMLNLKEIYLSGTLISREKSPPSYGVPVPPTISVNEGKENKNLPMNQKHYYSEAIFTMKKYVMNWCKCVSVQ